MGWLSIVVLVVSIAAAAATIGFYVATGVPALPTSPLVLGPLLVLVDRVPRRRVVDLGSGFGTLVLAVARRCPRSGVIGYEISPVPFLVSRLRIWLARLPNASVRYGDYFGAQLDGVDLVLCYLAHKPMPRLRDKLTKQLPPGAELICHTFAVPGWTPLETIRAPDLYHTPIYRYVRPAPAQEPVRHPWMEAPPRPEVRPSGRIESGSAESGSGGGPTAGAG
jgi:SAM-dependent methyltransferase